MMSREMAETLSSPDLQEWQLDLLVWRMVGCCLDFFFFVSEVWKPWILVGGGDSGNGEYTPCGNLPVTPAVPCEGCLAFCLLKTLHGHFILPTSCESVPGLSCVRLSIFVL